MDNLSSMRFDFGPEIFKNLIYYLYFNSALPRILLKLFENQYRWQKFLVGRCFCRNQIVLIFYINNVRSVQLNSVCRSPGDFRPTHVTLPPASSTFSASSAFSVTELTDASVLRVSIDSSDWHTVTASKKFRGRSPERTRSTR